MTDHQQLGEILADHEFEISGTPRHWESTPEKIAADNRAISRLEALMREARVTQDQIKNLLIINGCIEFGEFAESEQFTDWADNMATMIVNQK